MEPSRKDWKMFREKIGQWQEAYMEILTTQPATKQRKMASGALDSRGLAASQLTFLFCFSRSLSPAISAFTCWIRFASSSSHSSLIWAYTLRACFLPSGQMGE